MFGSIGRALAGLLNSTSSRNRPWQIAFAIALGVGCGLLPGVSLLKIAVLGMMFVMPVHLPLALFIAIATGLTGEALAPFAGHLGGWSLALPSVASCIAYLNTFPLVPWLRLDNTVVHGAAIMGLCQFIPTWLLVLPVARKVRRSQDHVQHKTLFDRADLDSQQELIPGVSYVNINSDIPSTDADKQVEAVQVEAVQADDAQDGDGLLNSEPTPYERVESFLAGCSDTAVDQLPAHDVAARASELAALVDEMLVAIQAEDDLKDKQGNVAIPTSQHAKIYTTYAEAADNNPSRRFNSQKLFGFDSNSSEIPAVDVGGLKMTNDVADRMVDAAQASASLTKKHRAHMDGSTEAGYRQATGGSFSVESTKSQAPVFVTVSPHEEALRHLLHHLKETRDKV